MIDHFHLSFRSDDDMADVSMSSQRTFSMAPSDVIKNMKEFDGKGNIALFPLFGSDFIRPEAVVLDSRMDISSWKKLGGRVRGKAKQPALDKLMHDFALMLRQKFRVILNRSSFPSNFVPSTDDLAELGQLWDGESLACLSKLWEQSYNLPALRLLVSFFDRVGGVSLPAEEVANMTKRELCEFLVSIGMMFMSPEYADGLVEELRIRLESPSLSLSGETVLSSGSDPVPSSSGADFLAYQLAFIRAVLVPNDVDFEASFSRSFGPEPLSSSSSNSGSASEPTAVRQSMSLQSFRASLFPAPPAKKPRIGSSSDPISFDIRGSVGSGSSLLLSFHSCLCFISLSPTQE